MSNQPNVAAPASRALRAATLEQESVVGVRRLSVRESNVIVLLLFAHMWLAQSTFKPFQIGIELALGATLIWIACRCRLDAFELCIVAVYLVSMVVAVPTNEFLIVMLNAKIYGLALLSLIVFSKTWVDMRWASVILGANLAMTVYQWALGEPAWSAAIIQNFSRNFSEHVGSRPLGLFLSVHTSAFLSGIFLVWLGSRRTLFGGGIVFLLIHRSFFVLAAYLCQLASDRLEKLHMQKLVAALAIGAIVVAVVNMESILAFDLTQVSEIFTDREQVGFTAIAEQVLSPQAYFDALTFIPRDSTLLAGDFINWAGNELMLFTLIQQGGLVLATLFLWRLFSRVWGFRVFLAVSLLHYGMASTPVAIFLMMQWSRRLRATDEVSATAANRRARGTVLRISRSEG